MRRRGVGGPGRRGAMMARRRAVRMRRRRRRRRIMLVGGLVAFGTYKLSKKDVEKVEAHTGKSAEELTDAEMETAVNDLGIEKQPLTTEEQQAVAQAEESDDSYEDEEDYIEELERLADLKEKGIITETEFETKKKALLGS